ncbi:CehA/McbA family metallohydrolase [candidate division KSB1 bacterium]|nr:CehA/McbA family metallohydrolase [candidate division KSB1 bacterium]
MKFITASLCLSFLLLLATSTLAQEPQAHGTLQFEIRDLDSNVLLPGKLVFLREGKPFELGVKSEGLVASRQSTIYTGDGKGSVKIPVGEYEVWAGRGLEYSADVHHVKITPEAEVQLTARLRCEVDTRGYVGGDMHLHTLTHSGHGDANVDERIISCIGEGLEWAVATDHNHHTDYGPFTQKLGLTAHMATTIGNEVSTPIGHFNAYPVPLLDPPIKHDLKNANELFKIIRTLSAAAVIQLNHPRWPGAAYFTEVDLDENFATSTNPNWSWDFDALEILNENRGLGWIAEAENPVSVKQDWFNLLNSGQRFTGVGNSDSHHVNEILAGVPRNYIASTSDDPAQLSEAELVQSLKQKNVSVNRGLYVQFSASEGAPIGSQISMTNGKMDFHIRVQAPRWIACDTVQLIGNGEVVETFAVATKDSVERFNRTITVTPKVDAWYLVIASGAKSMAPLVHDAPVPVTPLGFTNPIWVDAEGDGKFTSVYERAVATVRAHAAQPAELVGLLSSQPAMMKAAVGFMEQNVVEHETEILTQLLAHADLDLRLAIYRQLGSKKEPQAKAALQSAATHAQSPLEKMRIALARVAQGERAQWQIVLQNAAQVKDRRFLHAAFRNHPRKKPLMNWQVLGPFPYKGEHGLEMKHSVEKQIYPNAMYLNSAGKRIRWQKAPAPIGGLMDLIKIFGAYEKANAYASTEFTAAASGEMLFLLGSDDGVAMWLNGKEVHRNDAHRALTPGADIVIAPVQQGVNTLLLKIENGGGGWGFILEAVDVRGWMR